MLSPCRTGEHLQNCKYFECNMMYKCPGYYCLPWRYVCDGKWNCPKGLDENECFSSNNCYNMFKCSNSGMCVHLGNICDQYEDCPFGDDEYLCSISDKVCPQSCQCLTFAIRCFNLEFWKWSPSGSTHLFHTVHVENGKEIFVIQFLITLQFVIAVVLTRTSLKHICNILPSTKFFSINRHQLEFNSNNRKKLFQRGTSFEGIEI